MSGAAANERAFDPRLIGGVIAIGIIAFIALWALIALGPDLRSGNDGKGHALSRGAPGFGGIVDLLERAGAEVELRRRPERYGGGDQPLLILTPTHRTQPGEVAELLNAQGGAPTLVILPKWYALPIPNEAEKPGWSGPAMAVPPLFRSAERRGGKERVRTRRSRWSPFHLQKHTHSTNTTCQRTHTLR